MSWNAAIIPRILSSSMRILFSYIGYCSDVVDLSFAIDILINVAIVATHNILVSIRAPSLSYLNIVF